MRLRLSLNLLPMIVLPQRTTTTSGNRRNEDVLGQQCLRITQCLLRRYRLRSHLFGSQLGLTALILAF